MEDNKIKNFVRSPGGIIALFAIIIAVLAWIKPFQSDKREITYSLNENINLTADPSISKDGSLEFLYKEEKVQNIISTKLRLKNTGNQPVQESDFINDLTISFPESTRIINYQLVQAQPNSEPSLFQQGFLKKEKENKLNFKPVLINPGEIFDIDILSTRDNLGDLQNISYLENEIKLSYKIYGISRLNSVSEIKTNLDKKSEAQEFIGKYKTLLFFIFGTYVVLIFGEGLFGKKGGANIKFYLIILIIMSVLLTPSMYKILFLSV